MIEQVGLVDVLPPPDVEQRLDQPLEVPLEPSAATAQQAAEDPASAGAGAAPPPQPVAAPPPQPGADPAAEAPVEPDPPPPVAAQQEPANVNVSVRIDSPGDDGAVTQANAAADAEPQQYQPEAARYQPAVPDEPPPAQVDQAPAANVEPAWEWSWDWSCGDADVAPIAAPPGGVPETWIWNWNWNCGADDAAEANIPAEKSGGYHSRPAQYRPVNINISIRINSPGNNGPVVQTNVAVAVTVPAAPAPELHAPAVTPVAPAAAPFVEVASAAPEPVGSTGTLDVPAAPSELDDCCLLGEPRGVPYGAEAQAPTLAGRDDVAATGIPSLAGDTVAVAARLELQLRPRRPAQAAAEPPRPQVRPASPARQRRDDHEEPTVVVQSGLGIAPLGGPDRSLPFAALALLAFLFASANTSLASARSSPAQGADADDPPDRPG